MQQELRAGLLPDAADAEDVVDVGVRVGDVLDGDAHVARHRQDLVGLVAGVDADRLAGAPVADDPAVLRERPDDDAADDGLVNGRIGVAHRHEI